MIRSLYPTDLVAAFCFSKKALPNEASLSDRLSSASLLSPRALFEHSLPLRERRYTWVSFEGGRILGVVSAKGCRGCSAWHIDYLQVDDEDRSIALLDRVSAAAAGRGVKKVFLRLPSTSPLLDGARRAGFSSYVEERLYRYCGEGGLSAGQAPEPYFLSPRGDADTYPLVSLYNTVVPIPVRTAEGMTLEEWWESRDMVSWQKRHREFVLKEDSAVVGWLGMDAARGIGSFKIMFDHKLEQDGLEWLIKYALMSLDGRSPIFCVAFAFQGRLSGLLQELEFEEVTQYTRMLKEIAIRAREPSFVPVQA